jgi:hypothetical protein
MLTATQARRMFEALDYARELRAARSAEAQSAPQSCDNLSLDSVRGVADTLGVGLDEARRLLAHNRPEDWRA